MKKSYLLLLSISLFYFNSCWIAPVYQEYETVDKTCYFKDYETMRAVTVPKINKSFTEWHWSTKEFDTKFLKYLDNIEPNSEDLEYLEKNGYSWSVRNDSVKVVMKDNKSVSREYYWITNESGVSVIFFKNY